MQRGKKPQLQSILRTRSLLESSVSIWRCNYCSPGVVLAILIHEWDGEDCPAVLYKQKWQLWKLNSTKKLAITRSVTICAWLSCPSSDLMPLSNIDLSSDLTPLSNICICLENNISVSLIVAQLWCCMSRNGKKRLRAKQSLQASSWHLVPIIQYLCVAFMMGDSILALGKS